MKWAVLLSLTLLGCNTSGSAGEFGDDAGQDEGLPPDLPQPQCDPRREGDCPAGQKCSYVDDAEQGPTNRCVELLGDKLEGQSCERIGDSDDCGAHRVCWATAADGSAGICVGFCDAGLSCELDGTVCSVASGGLLPLCLPRCNPLAQDCYEGWGCYPDPGQRWVCDVDRSGALGGHGDPCACINCCDPGFACLSGALVDAEGCGADGAAGCCGMICALNRDDPCPSEAERCRAFYDPKELMMGLENVGTCRL
ncbi:MAG: hypothetical protein R6X02_03095 [Enhygromyxa sp.]